MGPQTIEKLITCESKNKFWNHSLWTWESDTNVPRAIQKHLSYKIRYNCFLKANKKSQKSRARKKYDEAHFTGDWHLFIYWIITTTGNRESKSPSPSVSNSDASHGAITKNTGPLRTPAAPSMLVCFLLVMRRKWSWKHLTF